MKYSILKDSGNFDINPVNRFYGNIDKLKDKAPEKIKQIIKKIDKPEDMYATSYGWKLIFEEINDVCDWLISLISIMGAENQTKNKTSDIINLIEYKEQISLDKNIILMGSLICKWVSIEMISLIIESWKADFINVFDFELIKRLNSLNDIYFERIIRLTDNNWLLLLLNRLNFGDNYDDINWREFPNIW